MASAFGKPSQPKATQADLWDMDNFHRGFESRPRLFHIDRNALNGADSAIFDLHCPSYKKSPAVAPASPTAVGKEGIVPTQANPKDIERLHHFFWAYIDEWQDRMRILVQLDLLPETKNQPLPHTMERMALESATTSDKLHSLWNAVMPHVPEPKRKPNPFPASEGPTTFPHRTCE